MVFRSDCVERLGICHRTGDPRPAEDRTKMFCRCATGFGEPENTRTCPYLPCRPGALPVANRAAVEWTVKLGLALGCDIAQYAVFHRKNYFYFDLPKGYQISQYDEPLCVNGSFAVPGEDGPLEIGIVRAHLEEDAAKTVHVGGESGRSSAPAVRSSTSTVAARRSSRSSRSRLPFRRGRARFPPTAAPDDRRARHLRRGDGEGHASL